MTKKELEEKDEIVFRLENLLRANNINPDAGNQVV